MQASALLLCWGSYHWTRNLWVLIIFPPCYIALCASKALHRLSSESVSWCLETSLFLRLPSWDRAPSLPLLSHFFVFYIFSYLFSKTMSWFSGYLMSSASIQKLLCGIYSAFKCSFDEFVGEKVVSPYYSSAILGPHLFTEILNGCIFIFLSVKIGCKSVELLTLIC